MEEDLLNGVLLDTVVSVEPELVEQVVGSHIKTLMPIFNMDIPKEIQEESSTNYSAGLTQDGVMSRGLTHEEELEYMPTVLGISPTSTEWNSKLYDFWIDFSAKIPYAGLDLECGFRKIGDKLQPINLKHYIIANLALNDKTVSSSANRNDAPIGTLYVLIDKAEQKKLEADNNQIKEDADRAYIKLIDGEDAVNNMQFVLMANTKKLNLPIIVVKEYDETELKSEIQKYKIAYPVDFVKNIKNLESIRYQAYIYEAVDLGLMFKSPGSGEYYYNDIQLGTLGQAVTTLKSKPTMMDDLLRDCKKMAAKSVR